MHLCANIGSLCLVIKLHELNLPNVSDKFRILISGFLSNFTYTRRNEIFLRLNASGDKCTNVTELFPLNAEVFISMLVLNDAHHCITLLIRLPLPYGIAALRHVNNRRHYLRNRQIKFCSKLEVALVVRGDRHDRAGAVVT